MDDKHVSLEKLLEEKEKEGKYRLPFFCDRFLRSEKKNWKGNKHQISASSGISSF